MNILAQLVRPQTHDYNHAVFDLLTTYIAEIVLVIVYTTIVLILYFHYIHGFCVNYKKKKQHEYLPPLEEDGRDHFTNLGSVDKRFFK